MRDFRESKGMAKTLREVLAERNVILNQSESLELISKLFGLPNWNVLAAKIEGAEKAHLLAPASEKTHDDEPRTLAISPFFIVSDVDRAVTFYADKLGFTVAYKEPSDRPFFAIIYRDTTQLFIKSEHGIDPVPNSRRHPNLRWDAYIFTPDPDALYADYVVRGAPFSGPVKDTGDGLRGFEVTDPDGFVLFFGRPR